MTVTESFTAATFQSCRKRRIGRHTCGTACPQPHNLHRVAGRHYRGGEDTIFDSRCNLCILSGRSAVGCLLYFLPWSLLCNIPILILITSYYPAADNADRSFHRAMFLRNAAASCQLVDSLSQMPPLLIPSRPSRVLVLVTGRFFSHACSIPHLNPPALHRPSNKNGLHRLVKNPSNDAASRRCAKLRQPSFTCPNLFDCHCHHLTIDVTFSRSENIRSSANCSSYGHRRW